MKRKEEEEEDEGREKRFGMLDEARDRQFKGNRRR